MIYSGILVMFIGIARAMKIFWNLISIILLFTNKMIAKRGNEDSAHSYVYCVFSMKDYLIYFIAKYFLKV